MQGQLIYLAVSYVVFTVLTIIPGWTICKKAGFRPALSLWCLIPIPGPFIVALVLTFADWPALSPGGRGNQP